jgi:transcriptional regulator with XRE-family HTH domain
MDRPSTGIDPLDDVLGGLRVGDNVVWQAPDPADIEPFVHAFLGSAHGTTPLTYLSFRLPPATVLDRFRAAWDADRFVLLDGWTGGPHAHPDPGTVTAGLSPPARVRRLKDPGDMDQVNRELAEIEDELGQGARYVFDDLTSMQRRWDPEAALALFLRCCPRLYQERTVAYWLLERDAHPPAFRSRLADITQVVVDLDPAPTEPGEHTLQVVKADGHPPEVTGRSMRYAVGDDGIDLLGQAAGTRERIGEQVRAQRIAAGVSQAELARRIGVSPSALSQVERGRHGLSGETLTRLWATLGVAFGPGSSPTLAPYRLARRGAHQPLAPGAGMQGETVLQEPSGLAMHVLTFDAATGSGRRPFETKQPELLLVLDGALELQLGQATHTLQQGDAILLTSQPVTGWRNPAGEPARLLWLLLPP